MRISPSRPLSLTIALCATLLAAGLALAACRPAQPPTPALPADTPDHTVTPTPLPTLTPTGAAPTLTAGVAATAPSNPAVLAPDNVIVMKEIEQLGRGSAEALAWWPGGQYLAVAGSQGLYLYDRNTLALSGHIETGDWLERVAFSPDGLTLALWGRTDAQLWETTSGQVLRRIHAYGGDARSLVFSSDGRTVAVGYGPGETAVEVWDAFTGRLLSTFPSPASEDAHAIAYNPRDNVLAWGRLSGGTLLWDGLLGEETAMLESGPTSSVAFSPRGDLLATGQAAAVEEASGPAIVLWTLGGDAPEVLRALLGHTGPITSLAFNQDGRMLASGSADGTVQVWDTATGQLLYVLEGHYSGVRYVAFNPDGQRVVSLGEAGDVRLWSVRSGEEIGLLNDHLQGVQGFTFSPDGRLAAAGTADGLLMVWDTASAEVQHVIQTQGGAMQGVALSPDGRTLAAGGLDGRVRLVNTATGAAQRALDTQPDATSSLAFSPDGALLARGGSDATGLQLWDAASGARLQTLPSGDAEPPYALVSLAFSADGQRVAAASSSPDSRIRVWEVRTGRLLQSIPVADGVLGVALNTTGTVVASGGADGVVRLWHVADGSDLLDLSGHTAAVTSAAFSPDGRLLVSGSADRTVRVWDVQAGQSVRRLEAHTDTVVGVVFSADGTRLASASADGTVEIWGLPEP